MKILLIEDNDTFAEDVQRALLSAGAESVDIAKSRDAATARIETAFYDLIILDLSLPTTDSGLDMAPAHGQSVFHAAQQTASGTPIYILTGSDPDAFTRKVVALGQRLNVLGGGAIPTVFYFVKEETPELVSNVKGLVARVADTEAITINTKGIDIQLRTEQRRSIKLFCRNNGGASCVVSKLGGLSEAMVLRIDVHDANGAIRTKTVSKLGRAEKIRKEITAYEREVKLLKLGAFANVVESHVEGLHGYAGIYYALADGYERTFFDVAQKAPKDLANVVPRLRAGFLDNWSKARKVVRTTVGDIRRRLLSDEKLSEIRNKYALDFIDAIEGIKLSAAQSCIHGDLHGGNVLVSSELLPVVIDYGDVDVGWSCIDPTILELSLLFHPDAVDRGLSDALSPHVSTWPSFEEYLKEHPLRPAIEACRQWAYEVGGSDMAVLAAAYAFTLRQLKYATIDSSITLALARAITDKIYAVHTAS